MFEDVVVDEQFTPGANVDGVVGSDAGRQQDRRQQTGRHRVLHGITSSFDVWSIGGWAPVTELRAAVIGPTGKGR